ncbi:MAG: TonB-dependent receptor [Sphingomicrobium sp.]
MPELPLDPPAIVVTASRGADEAGQTPASVTLIDATRIERLGAPLVPDLLRLVPSIAVAVSGPAGSLTQVRIRGAEANHTLLFVEGIAANDPAAGNEPRFELLNADLASRIEVVRGPQSALWGSEAIGGVVAVSGPAPGSGGTQAFAEYGSLDTLRGAARTSLGDTDRGLSFGIAGQRSDGIDSFSGDGDRDGYRNIGLRGSGRYRLSPTLLVGASGFAFAGTSQFDGYDPETFQRADTLDETRNRLAAGRLFADIGRRETRYASLVASLLGSSNRNLVGDVFVNRTSATRRTLAAEAGQTWGHHQLIAALESERETFRSRDDAYGGFSDQDRSRNHQSLTVEWSGRDFGPVSAGLAVRHDIFSGFNDATSVRASLLAEMGGGFAIAGNFGEGIARPSFFDLYGFFPGSFVGNPGLKPESSRGGEISLRFSDDKVDAAVTYYRQRLTDEIVGVFDFDTFLSSTANADGRSRRQGIEVEAAYRPSDALRLTATYAWLNASEPDVSGGVLKEQRRPKHSGSVAIDGVRGRLSYGAAIAYSGARIDTNFDIFPASRVTLDAYWLASAQLGYRVAGPVEVTLRIANALGDRYQDVVGYRTQGRSVHAGLRVALGR